MSFSCNASTSPVAGVYVERKTSLAYSTTAVGGSGPTASDIANETVSQLNATTIPVDVQKMNGANVLGTGIESDKWRGSV